MSVLHAAMHYAKQDNCMCSLDWSIIAGLWQTESMWIPLNVDHANMVANIFFNDTNFAIYAMICSNGLNTSSKRYIINHGRGFVAFGNKVYNETESILPYFIILYHYLFTMTISQYDFLRSKMMPWNHIRVDTVFCPLANIHIRRCTST